MKAFLQRYGLFLLASAFFCVQGVIAIAEDTPVSVYGTVVLWCAAVLAFQLGIVWLAGRRFPSPAVETGLAALFVALNAVAFYLAFVHAFIDLGTAGRLFVLVAAWSIAAHVLQGAARRPVLGATLCAILAINMVVSVGYAMVTGRDAGAPPSPDLHRYDGIAFKERPNVHLVAVDSLLPKVLAEKHLGLSPEYDRVLRESGAIMLPNMFASFAPTTHSLPSVARLSDPGFRSAGAFAGRVLDPLYHVFRNNGYRISAGYNSGKKAFGGKGPYVDEYFSNNPYGRLFQESALCKYQGKGERYLQLFGFCPLAKRLEPRASQPWKDFVVAHLGALGDSGEREAPWLTFYYVYSVLGHTKVDYETEDVTDFREYREQFDAKQRDLSNGWLKDLIATIRAKDPHSIVFIFGDHGPWLSRTADARKDPGFFVRDRYGVLGAILATDAPCARSDETRHYYQGFGTPERVIAGIVRCLAERPEAVDRAVRFSSQYDFARFPYE